MIAIEDECSMPLTVLIVDDSKLARMVAARALREARPDWLKLEAANAAAALDILDCEKVDLALIDFNMPDKDGLTLAEELRAAGGTLPVALITANVQDEIIDRARSAGATFIAKPITTGALEPFLSAAEHQLAMEE